MCLHMVKIYWQAIEMKSLLEAQATWQVKKPSFEKKFSFSSMMMYEYVV